VAAVWDDVAERGRRYAAMANAPFVADLDALLADPAVDGFVICAENTRHLPLLRKALPAGKPVFCEKPLVTNTGDLAEVKALLAQYPTTLFCGYFQPFERRCRRREVTVSFANETITVRPTSQNVQESFYGYFTFKKVNSGLESSGKRPRFKAP